jgi:hypothetical protein
MDVPPLRRKPRTPYQKNKLAETGLRYWHSSSISTGASTSAVGINRTRPHLPSRTPDAGGALPGLVTLMVSGLICSIVSARLGQHLVLLNVGQQIQGFWGRAAPPGHGWGTPPMR